MISTRCIPMIFILSAAGCGAGQAEFTGQVTFRGKPVYRGSITVVGDDKVPHVAAIGEDGTFRFAKVPTGVVKVGVLCPEPPATECSPSTDLGQKLAGAGITLATPDARKRWFRIPTYLGDPNSSNLTVEIEAPATSRQIELPE